MGEASQSALLTYSAQDRLVQVTHADGRRERISSTLFDFLKQDLAARRADAELPFDFVGGWIGYTGYEARADLGHSVAHASPYPDALYLDVDRFLAFDHLTREVYLVASGAVSEAALRDRLQVLVLDIEQGHPQQNSAAPTMECSRSTVRESLNRPAYLERVKSCQDLIREGESYEICLTMNAECETSCSPLDFYRLLRRRSPTPYAAFLRIDDIAVACASPERFLRLSRDGAVESKPIKGTASRGATPERDAELRAALQCSVKNRAENLMIVDLLRHDLSRVCDIGSVTVPSINAIETYRTVHQMVSTIRGQVRAGVDCIDVLSHAFPGGSMTGAPKRRTMRLLDQLENEARGVYSGTLGFFSLNGCMDLNIVIRTAVFNRGQVRIGMGGAVTLLSDPEDEYREARLKGRVLLDTLAEAEALSQAR